MYHILSIPSSVGHLGCFHLLVIVSNALVNMGIQFFLCDPALGYLGSKIGYLGSKIAKYGISNLYFLRNHHTVFHNRYTVSQFLHIPTNTHIGYFFNSNYPNVCVLSFFGNLIFFPIIFSPFLPLNLRTLTLLESTSFCKYCTLSSYLLCKCSVPLLFSFTTRNSLACFLFVNGSILFFLMAELVFCSCIFSIQSFISGHVDCFCVLVTVNVEHVLSGW